MNVIGEPVDEAGPIKTQRQRAIHQHRADVRRAVDRSADPGHRHQGRRPAGALRQGRQDRPVRRRRRRQDRADHGADQQRRQGARRLFGVRRRRRAHARGQRPLPRDDRVRRQQGADDGSADGSKAALVYGQMNEPPGARVRVALYRPDRRRALPRPGPGRAVLRRQHLPLHAGGLGSVGAARPHSLGRGLSADARHRHGRPAGAHHDDAEGLDHLGAGHLRAGRRLDRPGAGDLVRPLGRDHRAVALDRREGHLSGGRPARLDLAHARPARRRRGALRRRPPGAVDPAALQVAAGHHRHSRHGRAVAKRTR